MQNSCEGHEVEFFLAQKWTFFASDNYGCQNWYIHIQFVGLGFNSNDAMMQQSILNVQGLQLKTKSWCYIMAMLSKLFLVVWGVRTLNAKCKEWGWMCVFLQSNLSNPMFICMFWKIESFALNRQWGVAFSSAFEKFKSQKVLNIFVLGVLCKLFKVHSKQFNTP